MKKRMVMVAVISLLLVFVAGCSSPVVEAPPIDDAPQDVGAVLIEPLPQRGLKVAEINGYDYYYDTHYMFKVFGKTSDNRPSDMEIREAVFKELCAAEAAEQGIVPDTSYHGRLEKIYYSVAYRHEDLWESREIWGDIPKSDAEKLKENLEKAEKEVERYNVMIDEICTEEDITREELFSAQEAYDEKYGLILDYLVGFNGNRSLSEGEDINDPIVFEKEMEELFKKYNVKFVE